MIPININYIWKVNELDVYYTNETNGGGDAFAEDYCNIIDGLYGDRVFKNALEWCSGPGFIGYAILATGLCNRITFNDIHQPALDMAELTKLKNPLFADKISIYQGSTLECISESEKFDLVVANPPHYLSKQDASVSLGYDRMGIQIGERNAEKVVDPFWKAHINFYNSIKKRLAPDGIILIQENQSGSPYRAGNFSHMIENAGLKIVREISSLELYDTETSMQIYYIEVTHK
jgi:methylase of polypeptide subunit release factors